MAVLTHPSLLNCLSKSPIRSPSQQLQLWESQKKLHQRTTSLISSLGKPSISALQAKKLDSVGLSNVADLEKHFSESKDQNDFSSTLMAMNVNSQPLQEKLWKLLKSKAKAH